MLTLFCATFKKNMILYINQIEREIEIKIYPYIKKRDFM